MTSSSLGYLVEEGLDFGFELLDFGVDFGDYITDTAEAEPVTAATPTASPSAKPVFDR